MPIKSIINYSNESIDTIFYPTLPMSTYTLALVISDYECLSTTLNNSLSKNLKISACARSNALYQIENLFNMNTTILCILI